MTEKEIHHKNCGWPYYTVKRSHLKHPASELLIIAECVANAYAEMANNFLQKKNIDLLCPKLDNNSQCIQKLSKVIIEHKVTKIVTVEMELHCCGILTRLVKEAIALTNKEITLTEKIITKGGQLKRK